MMDICNYIIWQDEYLVVLDKPPGISVNPSATEKGLTLVELVSAGLHISIDRAGIIHRLDKDTSGVLLIAKDQETFVRMQEQFKKRVVYKEYLALTHGWFESDSGTIDAPIERHPFRRERFTVLAGGRDSVTDFFVERRYIFPFEKIVALVGRMTKKERAFFESQAMRYSLVRLLPRTGRTHQLRVHLKYIHHPIVCDHVYVGRKLLRFDSRICARQFLHAACISFQHPVTLAPLSFSSPLPADLSLCLQYFQ